MNDAEGVSNDVVITSRELSPREIPKLAGSTAGFVVLIVALCLIIITSLVATLLLLREDKTSDEENQGSKPSTYVTRLEDEAGAGPSSWLRRTYLRIPFIRTVSADRVPSVKFPRPPHRGERPSTSSADDPASESRDQFHLDVPQPRYLNRHAQLERLGHYSSFSSGPSVKRLSTLSTSTASVRFETSPVREIYPHERDRFAPSPTATLPHIHTQMSSPTSSLASSPVMSPRKPRIVSQEIPSIDLSISVRNSGINASSSSAPQTFEGGTKFLEAL